jgi:O-antigen/teichoic acid export membrane protein
VENRNAKYLEAKQLFQESTILNASLYGLTAFKFVSGFLVARFLGPSLYGLRTVFGLVVDYEYFSHLGTFDAARREVPYLRGNRDDEKAQTILNNVFGINLLYSLIVLGAMVVAAVIMRTENFQRVYIDFVLFLGVYCVLGKVNAFYTIKLTVDKRSNVLSRARLIDGFTYALFCISLTYLFSMRGLFVGLLISSLVVAIYMYANIREIPPLQMSPGIIIGLLKIGFPIMVIGLMFIVMRSVDRIIIASLLNREMLGYFAIGTIVSGFVYATIGDIARVIFAPRIMERLGETGDTQSIKNYFIEPTIIAAYFTPYIAGPLFLGMHIPIRYFLPEYMPALSVVRILVLGAFFISIVMMPAMICVAINKQVNVVLLFSAAISIDAILSCLLIHFGWGISGVAVGTLISYFALSFVTICYTLRQFKAQVKESTKFIGLVYAPFFYLSVLVIGLEKVIDINTMSMWQDMLYTGLRIGLFAIVFSLSFISIRKHLAIKKLFSSLRLKHFGAVSSSGATEVE